MSHEDQFYGIDKLFTLKDASDASRMHRLLEPVLPQLVGADAHLLALDLEVLRRRKQRCVLRYRLGWSREDGTSGSLSLIGKVYKGDAGEEVSELMRRLWDAGFDRDAADQIAIPAVAAYMPRLSLLLQEEIGGRPVKDFLSTTDAERALRQMAVGLAKLHRTPVRWGEPFTMNDHLRRCHPRPQVLHDRCPELRPAIDEILREAARLESSYAFQPSLIHGDCHMGQVHVTTGRTWIIDFDAACIADPAADLGNLLVFLKGKARKIPNAPLLAEAFLDEYCKHMPSDVLRRVPLFEAITHLRRACKRLRFGEDGWQKKARKFIDESLESLAAARG